MVGGRPWAPEELSARLVRWVVDRVAEREGGPADRIAVTHPASWGQHKKELLAARAGGAGPHRHVPGRAAGGRAAATPPTSGSAGGSTIAVYDLGGGTFDAAVVRKGDDGGTGFGLLGRPEGLERLGGIDFDEAVFEHVREGMPDAFAELDDTDPAVLSAVARDPARVHRGQGGAQQRHRGVHPGAAARRRAVRCGCTAASSRR